VKRLFPNSFFGRFLVAVCVILLGLLLVRPQAQRVRWRASQSISAAIGKRVQIGSLHLRFLPRLGFEFGDFVIYDDASFGSEPLLRAADVSASLRLTSLFRGRFEISGLEFTNASLNLTRDSQGKWNLQELLQRTAHFPGAPKLSTHPETRPEFPYIEASHARINFKIGIEKTHFALTDAEFALWQESESQWGMRLRAHPIRTDANLTDTGVINVNGSWQRTDSPEQALVKVGFQWKQAQAGQVSKLIWGADKGWRGSVLIFGTLSGTTQNVKIVADTSIDDLGRYDVFNDDSLRLAARCLADYDFSGNSVSDVHCAAPVGSGLLELKGNATGLPFTSYRFAVTGSRVPAAALLNLLNHTAAGVSHNLNLDGSLNSTIELARTNSSDPVQWKGNGELVDLALSDGNAMGPVRLQHVPFAIISGSDASHPVNIPRLDIGPMTLALGRPTPFQARASISRVGYEASVHGEAGVTRLLQVAQVLHIPAPAVSVDGTSSVDLAISGTWAEGVPTVTGSAQLRNVRAQVRGLNAPLDIRNASLLLAKDSLRVQNINALAGETQWHGSMLVSRPCPTPHDCTVQFNLRAGEINAASLNSLLNPLARKQSWYKFLSFRERPTPYLLQARANGKIFVDKLITGNSSSSQLSADVSIDEGKLTLTNMRATVLGGRVAGEWRADFLARPPIYRGHGNIEDISLGEISDLMHDGWIEGTGSTDYEFKSAGRGLQDLIANADLNADFTLENAHFPHVVLTSKGAPLHAKTFSGKLALQDGTFSFQDAKLESPEGIYTVSGTASMSGALKLKMTNEGTSGYDLSGTLMQTRVSQMAASTRASLQP
jgi:uncharacterized protein involved in outer membrane biogenesis